MRRRIRRTRWHGSYAFTRSPVAADLSMAAMTSWRLAVLESALDKVTVDCTFG